MTQRYRHLVPNCEKLLLRGELDYNQDQREKRLNQKFFQEVDPQIKQMFYQILSPCFFIIYLYKFSISLEFLI